MAYAGGVANGRVHKRTKRRRFEHWRGPAGEFVRHTGPDATGSQFMNRDTSPAVERVGAPTADIDNYLARVPEPARTALENLRKTIRAAAPNATEAINYKLPTFRHLGMLVGYGATTKHCALYVMSGSVLNPFKDELSAYDTSKGTIRFPANAPLPSALVRKIVKARVLENEARALLKAEKRRRAGTDFPR
jgi:uncharacterized protein YdhG (YjbR/CyaY superfamily)